MKRQCPFNGKKLQYKAVPRHKAKFMRGQGWSVHTDNSMQDGIIMCKAF